MATRKSSTTRRPARSDYTPDFPDSPFRIAYSYVSRCHVVVEVATGEAVNWFERGEYQRAYEICAAHNSDAAAVANTDYAVYCEACGEAVDPALAVLDGELMVCPGCAPCSAAEFEAMQMAEAERLMAAEIIEATYPVLDAALEANDTDAYYSALRAANESLDALVPDPATWVAVSETPCEPVTAPRFEICDDAWYSIIWDNEAQRSVWRGEKADAATKLAEFFAEAELDRVDAELSARCACYATGNEQQACLDAGRPVCERETRRARWLAHQEQLRQAARQLGPLGTLDPSPAPVIVPDLHPSPEMPLETYAAIWDARTAALAGVADALRGNADLPFVAATAHVSLTCRIELRRGFHGYLAVQVDEDAQGYASGYLRTFGDEDEGRQWISDEAVRQARATRALTS